VATWDETVNDAAALRAYLDALDARLAHDGVAIAARPIHAWMAIQSDMGLCVSLGDPCMKPVDDYFDTKYGRRALMDMSVGAAAGSLRTRSMVTALSDRVRSGACGHSRNDRGRHP